MNSMTTVLLTYLSCATSDETLSNTALLTRVSLDASWGSVASIEELDAAMNRRWSLEDTVDTYLTDPELSHG